MHKVCPFCGEELPDLRSGSLEAKLEQLIEEAELDPTPENPHAMLLPFTRFISFCAQHLHEEKGLETARREGWPLEPDFDALPQRVRNLKPELEAILEDPDSSTFFVLAKNSRKSGGSGVLRTFQTFGKQGAAYYGQKGFAVLADTLRAVFPQGSIPHGITASLDYWGLVEEVLIPEAAILLIMQDKNVSEEKAREIHEDSRSFGVMQHSVDDEGH
ncbi:hypothetical protein FA13DRAFT_1634593 [Coprinellus micaceus]|uniref:Restriction of telomere capping protein 4 n=1 Tax=Coprinellus micaceus TaxID=71717 RepID=A0A4Y7T1S9_COPMI|nr:hypothetical protein FA13DRAFT_1634593 [Coprinellus micaceus]